MINTFEGGEPTRATQTLSPPPDCGAIFRNTRVDDFTVVIAA
jgi:hypothetical protein